MAVSTNEEQPDNQEKRQPENQSENPAPFKAGETNPPNQDSRNMEVHHHAHHEGKKSWKSYFWEFLMLFFAVFCGYLAEYKLETTIEDHRAKEYAYSMAQDLAADTAQLNDYILRMSIAAQNVDSFLHLISYSDIQKIPTGVLYYYGLFGGTPIKFVPNDATIQQMKGSGSLRYFKNKSVNQNVAKYDRLMRMLQTKQDYDVTIFSEVRKSRAKIFLLRYNSDANDAYQLFMKDGSTAAIDSFITSNPPLLTYDKALLNDYAEMVRSRFLGSFVTLSESLKAQAVVLLHELNKEYNLK